MVEAFDKVLTLEPDHVILATAAASAGSVAGARVLRERLRARSGRRVGVALGAGTILAALHRQRMTNGQGDHSQAAEVLCWSRTEGKIRICLRLSENHSCAPSTLGIVAKHRQDDATGPKDGIQIGSRGYAKPHGWRAAAADAHRRG